MLLLLILMLPLCCSIACLVACRELRCFHRCIKAWCSQLGQLVSSCATRQTGSNLFPAPQTQLSCAKC